MFSLIDSYLLKRPCGPDDWTLSSSRIDGQRCQLPVIFFLPWNMPFWLAKRLGLVTRQFLACYELAPALVSSEPDLSVKALRKVTEDAQCLLSSRNIPGSSTIVVGYSLGTYPATFLANRLKARLYSIAPADRGDLMIWESPAARTVRSRALSKGYSIEDYVKAMSGYNPVDNLEGIGIGSAFFIGRSDPFVPAERSNALINAIARTCQSARVIRNVGGHVRTLLSGAQSLKHELQGLHNEIANSWRAG